MKGVGMERHRRTGRTHPGVGCGTQPGGRASTPHRISLRLPARSPQSSRWGDKRRAPSSRWGGKRPAP